MGLIIQHINYDRKVITVLLLQLILNDGSAFEKLYEQYLFSMNENGTFQSSTVNYSFSNAFCAIIHVSRRACSIWVNTKLTYDTHGSGAFVQNDDPSLLYAMNAAYYFWFIQNEGKY